MAHMLAKTAALRGDAAALIDEHGETTWTALNARVNRLIQALRGAGLGPGDRVALFAGNSREYFEIMAAAGHIGVTYVPVNWHFTAEELAYVIANSEARGLITDAPFLSTAQRALARPDCPAVSLKVCIGASAERFVEYETFMHAGTEPDEPTEQCMGGPMFYTSGTTGRPKGVTGRSGATPPPIQMLEMMAAGLPAMLQIPPDGTTLLAGPVYHSAQWAWSYLPLLAGSSVVSRQRFEAAEVLQLIDAHHITNIHLVPTQFRRMLQLDEADRENFDGSSLRAVWHGAAPCPPEIKRRMIDWWGPHIFEYYGSTEGSIVTTISSDDWLARPGSVGRATAMMEVRIVRDDGSPAGVGEEGTIYMKSTSGQSFEYYKEEAKTREAYLEPGVFTTGDVGWLDADGFLYMSDRKIDMIISGGVNIYPAEIEAVLQTHPAVADAAVFGVPNDEFGEEVKAVVQVLPHLEESAKLAADLIALCREHLAGYKAPRSVDFVNDFPRTDTGKLQKRLLRERYWEGSGRRI